MFNYEYPPLGGGGGVVHKHIAEELARRHEIVVVTSHYKGLPTSEMSGGVRVHRVSVLGRKSLSTASTLSMLSFYPASMKKGQEVIDHFQPDVINTHFAIPTGPSAVRLAERNRIPHALCIHGGDIFDPSKLLSPHHTPGLRQTVRWVLRHVDRVLAQSKNTAENTKRIYGVPGEITIIPHALEAPRLPPFDRSKIGLAEDQIALVTVGRLIARKANHQLIEILARLSNPKVVLFIIGEGPERTHLLDLAKRLDVADRLFMPGFVNEERKVELLQAADVFVSTTQHEGFGLIYIEGMFCGLPIVTYDHGGQVDFLEHGQTGYVVSLNNQESFQMYLEMLIETPRLRKTMGEYNLKLSQQFTIEQCASRYEATFEEMVEEAAPASSVHRCNDRC